MTGAGLFDLAILGYPAMLIFAAIMGGTGLFFSTLAFVIILCILLTYLTLNQIIVPNTPVLSWVHLIFILVIFIVVGFSIYILITDMKRLMISLEKENSKVEESRKRIRYLARHDNLTNLPNRFYGEHLFSYCLKECEESNQGLAVLFINLDNFKPINDVLGHNAGDELLNSLSQRLQHILPKKYHLIRFGGDEFLIIAPMRKVKKKVKEVCELLIEQCSNEFDVLETNVAVSASIGVAIARKHGETFDKISRCADIAMHKAKQNGRNTYCIYDETLEIDSDTNFKLLQSLRAAINERKFELYYQPLVNLKSNRVDTIEALLRWPQADGTFIPPDKFIPLCEQSGLINELGAWVIQEACQFCAYQRSKGFEGLRIAINLSAMQFKNGQLQQLIEKSLAMANLPASAVELELTESLLMEDVKSTRKQINKLIALGLTIAIDDFGTGYSNLAYLQNFEASRLKIDRSFILELGESKNEALIEAIINMARSLGLQTVAEGIENDAALEKLTSLNCELGQGFYWSKPVSGSKLPALIEQINA